MKCPLCDIALLSAPVGEAPAHRCGHCLGLWLPKGSLPVILSSPANRAAIRDVDTRRATWEQPPDKRRCPGCGGGLYEHYYGGTTPDRFISETEVIRIDSCADCGGIWLDRGELLRIHDLKTKGELHSGQDRALALGMTAMERERRELREGPRRVGELRFVEMGINAAQHSVPPALHLAEELAGLLFARLMK